MPHRSFDQLLACMRLAAGSDPEALALVASFEETVMLILVKPGEDARMMRRDPTGQDPSRVLVLVPSEDGEDLPIASISAVTFEDGNRLDAIHLLPDACADEWLGIQLLLMWHQLLADLEIGVVSGEFNEAVAEADRLGASPQARRAQIKHAQDAVDAMEAKAEQARFHLAARLIDARFGGTLARSWTECPKLLTKNDRGAWLGRRVYAKICQNPPIVSLRDEDTRDYALNCAINWFVRDEPKSDPVTRSLC